MTHTEYESITKELREARYADSRSRLERAQEAFDRAAEELARVWTFGLTEVRTNAGFHTLDVHLDHNEYDNEDISSLERALTVLSQIREWKIGKRDSLPPEAKEQEK